VSIDSVHNSPTTQHVATYCRTAPRFHLNCVAFEKQSKLMS